MLARTVPGWLVLIVACVASSCAKVTISSSVDGGGGQSGAGGAKPDAAADGRSPDQIIRPPGTGGCAGTSGATGGCNLCGNGALNTPGETCDDGDQQGGDGC